MNVIFYLEWVSSAVNFADQLLREWLDFDVKFVLKFWELEEFIAGLYFIDFMVLDFNSQCYGYYTFYLIFLFIGINFFIYNLGFDEYGREENGYLFFFIYFIGFVF